MGMKMLHLIFGHRWCNGHGGGYKCCKCGAMAALLLLLSAWPVAAQQTPTGDTAINVNCVSGCSGGSGTTVAKQGARDATVQPWYARLFSGDGTAVELPESLDADGGFKVHLQNSISFDGAQPVTQSGVWSFSFTAPQHVIIDSSASIAVTGPLTDTQLRATPVPVSGTVSSTQGTSPWIVGDGSGALTVDGTVAIDGTVASTQSGNWSVRTQDGLGNFLESLTSNPVGTERGLIVRNISSGTQPISAVSLPLPTNASTLTEQQTQSTSLASIAARGASTTDAGAFTTTATVTNPVGRPLDVNIANMSGWPVGKDGVEVNATQKGNWNALASQGTAAALTSGWPMTSGVVQAQAAQWTSATSGNTALTMNTQGYSTASLSVNVTGTITAGRIDFEGSDDAGTTWFPVGCVTAQRTTGPEIYATLLTSLKFLWQCDVTGYNQFRARLNTVISGTGIAAVRLQGAAQTIGAFNLQQQTYYAMSISTASGASQDYLTLFNASGSNKVLRVQRITIAGANTAAVVGVGATFNVNKVSTAGSTCTSKTIQLADATNAAVPAQVTATSICTSDPTITFTFQACHTAVDETQIINNPVDCYVFSNTGNQPLTLREGEGVSLVTTAAPAPVGLITVFIEFTM